MKVRVGIPLTGGRLVEAARVAGHPVLFSANAFFVPHDRADARAGEFKRFREIDPLQFEGLDAALDSAGFVAAVKYGDYRWTMESYLQLAAAYPWAFYASMDYCCEPQVSRDRPLRLLRMAATANMLGRLNRMADERLMARPMPVIQGWTAAEYVECARWMPLAEWPALVGIGSVCRRHMHGPDGLFAILEALDRELPSHVKLHLFGVKSSALEKLSGHPRIESTDSMAWDFGARVERRTGRDMDFRIEKMNAWADRQRNIVDLAVERRERDELDALGGMFLPDRQAMLFPVEDLPVPARRVAGSATEVAVHQEIVLEALALCYADLLLSSDIEYRDAVDMSRHDAYPLLGRLHNNGILDAASETAAELAGFADHMLATCERYRPALVDELAAELGREVGRVSLPKRRQA